MVWVIWPYTKKIQFDAMPDDVPSSTVLDHLRLRHTRGATSTATRKQVCFDGSSKARRKKKRCCRCRSHSSNQRRLSLSDFLLLHNIRELLLLPRWWWRHARKHARWTGLLFCCFQGEYYESTRTAFSQRKSAFWGALLCSFRTAFLASIHR